MHFHQHGYVSADPRIEAAAGYGIDRPADLPDEVDVLIVGSGPAGHGRRGSAVSVSQR